LTAIKLTSPFLT